MLFVLIFSYVASLHNETEMEVDAEMCEVDAVPESREENACHISKDQNLVNNGTTASTAG